MSTIFIFEGDGGLQENDEDGTEDDCKDEIFAQWDFHIREDTDNEDFLDDLHLKRLGKLTRSRCISKLLFSY